jgi:hypothetical protein
MIVSVIMNVSEQRTLHSKFRITLFFLISWGGVRLTVSPLGTWATNWPIIPALDDR